MTDKVEADSEVVVPQQDAIPIFSNDSAGITIVQADPMGNEPALVWFDARHAETVSAAILDVAKRIRERS